METVALEIWTSPYPTISNNIEIRVYDQADELAVIDSLKYPAPHPQRSWSFPGLDRINYVFRVFEMSGATIVRELGEKMYVVPADYQGIAFKNSEQIQVDTTAGLVGGETTATFTDWIGWAIDSIERIGTGTMKKDIDYSWNINTGELTLLQPGDLFGPEEWFHVVFAAKQTSVTSSVSNSSVVSSVKIVTANYLVTPGDMGGLIIMDPGTEYMELTLPDINTVVAGKVLDIEMRKSKENKCARMQVFASEFIDWLTPYRTDIYMCPNEYLSVFKFIDTTDADAPVSMWRIRHPFGNYMKVGEQLSDDSAADMVFNKILLDGTSLSTFAFARLYYEYVLQLPAGQLVDYDNWATGNNKLKFSRANSSNPANAGYFHVPDRRNKFERNTDGTRLPGALQSGQVGQFDLSLNGDKLKKSGTGVEVIVLDHGLDVNLGKQSVNMGTINTGKENLVENIAVRKYLFV